MSKEKNKCITEIMIKKKLHKIKAFKQQVVGIKPEELKNEPITKFITGEKAKTKMDSLYLPNCLEQSAKKPKLKLVTRNQLYIYLDEPRKNKGKNLCPITEERKNGKSSQKCRSCRLANGNSNKTIQIKAFKINSKEQILSKNISDSNLLKNNKDKEEEKVIEKESENKNEKELKDEKEKEKDNEKTIKEEKEKEKEIKEDNKKKEEKKNEKNNEKNKKYEKGKENGKENDKKEENQKKEEKDKEREKKEEIKKENDESREKVNSEENKKSIELKPIILKGRNINIKVSNDISVLKNAIREDSEERKNNNINSKSLNLTKDNNKLKSPVKKEYKLQYCVYPGNNSALIDKVMAHRLYDWEKVPTTFAEFCDLVWAPLAGTINFQNCEKRHQYANHIEFNIEISNKMRLFANLLRHCEEKKIDAFSIFPFTISLQLSHWSFSEQLSNFKKLFYNIDYYTPKSNKKFCNMFNVILSRKIGSMQTINIPPSFNSGKNLWIIKPINLNRGRFITVEKNLKDIIEKLEVIQEKKKINICEKKKTYEIKCEYILIQKYLEKPLLYQGRKFDIRLWVLFIAEQVDDVYIFRQGHLKATCGQYDPDSNDLYVHLTNYSVQKYNQNFSKIEIGNEIPFKDFQHELDKMNTGINFYRDIYPKIVKIVRITGGAAKGKMNFLNKKYCFEIFGYDFILDERYQPYLLEINTNPGLEISSPIINELLPRMIDDALKLTIDKEFTRSMKYADEKSIFHVYDNDDNKNMWEKYSII